MATFRFSLVAFQVFGSNAGGANQKLSPGGVRRDPGYLILIQYISGFFYVRWIRYGF